MMQKILRAAIFVLLLLVLIFGFRPEAFAQSSPVVVRIAPASLQVAAGGTVDLAIEVVSGSNMYGFDAEVSFNPQAIEVVDADPSKAGVQVAMGTLMDPGFLILNQADNTAGTIRVATTQLNPSDPKTGSGNLVVVRFKGKQVNLTSEIKLNKVQIAQPNGDKIPDLAGEWGDQSRPDCQRSNKHRHPHPGGRHTHASKLYRSSRGQLYSSKWWSPAYDGLAIDGHPRSAFRLRLYQHCFNQRASNPPIWGGRYS